MAAPMNSASKMFSQLRFGICSSKRAVCILKRSPTRKERAIIVRTYAISSSESDKWKKLKWKDFQTGVDRLEVEGEYLSNLTV